MQRLLLAPGPMGSPRRWGRVVLAAVAMLASCKQSPDDDDDDDDSVIETTLFGRAFEPISDAGIEAATIFLRSAPGEPVPTDEGGYYELRAPHETDVDVHAQKDGLVETVAAIQTGWQLSLAEGVMHPMFTETAFSTLHEALLELPRDAADAALWVQVSSGELALYGSAVEISSPYDGVFAFGPGWAEPGNVLLQDALYVAFANVTPGPATVALTPAEGYGDCQGRADLDLLAGTLTLLRYECLPESGKEPPPE